MAGNDCHGTWKYWPASGPVFKTTSNDLEVIAGTNDQGFRKINVILPPDSDWVQ